MFHHALILMFLSQIQHPLRVLDRRVPAHLCAYWFRWLLTNHFWFVASFSRLMLCGWQMSATINRLMLPAFPEPTTNPSIWVTVGSTGRQRHVCAGTHWSSYCLSLLGSFIQSLSPTLHHAKTPPTPAPAQHSTWKRIKNCTLIQLVLSYPMYVIFWIYYTPASHRACGDIARIPQSVEPAEPICLYILFRAHLWMELITQIMLRTFLKKFKT